MTMMVTDSLWESTPMILLHVSVEPTSFGAVAQPTSEAADEGVMPSPPLGNGHGVLFPAVAGGDGQNGAGP